MVSRLILGTTLSLALVLCPYFSSDIQAARPPKKKTSRSAIKAKSSHKKASKRTARKYRSRQAYEFTAGEATSSSTSWQPQYYRAGIGDSRPLMKVIPQRDGRFILEPLQPQRKSNIYEAPITRDRQIETPPPRRDDYSAIKSSGPIAPRCNFAELIQTLAKRYQGAAYSRGASLMQSSATDCSGFVQYVYQNFMLEMPRNSSEQAQVGKLVTTTMDFSKMLPGDLLFFRRGGRGIGHVGIYLGNGKMIHASSPRNGITITDLNQPYYINTFVVAKRVVEIKYPD